MPYKKKFVPKTKEQLQEQKELQQKQINDLTEKTDKEVSEYFNSPEKLTEYLQFMGQFHKYSPRNQRLIKGQFEQAHAVGSYDYWKKKGTPVQKGEKGIKVLVPLINEGKFKNEKGEWKSKNEASFQEKERLKNKELTETKGYIHFKFGNVFDISQTSTPPEAYPEMFPNRPINGKIENYDVIMAGLKDVAAKEGVDIVKPAKELGKAKGVYYPALHEIELNPRNTPFDNVTVLIHELSHAKMHNKDKFHETEPHEKEFQAEMVNKVVSSYMGIENEDSSKNSLSYISTWTKGKTLSDKTKLLDEVKATSQDIIKTLETHIDKSKGADRTLEKKKKQKEVEPV